MRAELQSVLQSLETIPVEELPRLLGELREVEATALARLSAPAPLVQQPDSLLNVSNAAERLGMSENYLYRHARTFPFTRYEGRSVRFSSLGIDRYIAQRRK